MEIHKLTIAQAKSLTEEDFLAIDAEGLAKFSGEAHLRLLAAIRERALTVLGCKHPVYQLIYRKWYWLKNNDKINKDRREKFAEAAAAAGKDYTPRNKNVDEVNVFPEDYDEDKYKYHQAMEESWTTGILKIYGGKVIEKVEPLRKEDLPDDFEGSSKVKESGLYLSTYLKVKDMTPRQKNDTVSIMGRGFGFNEPDGFDHGTAAVTHRILREENQCAVMLVKYVPDVPVGETKMVYVVGAAVFVPVLTMRHRPNGKESRVQWQKIDAVNLVQIAILPRWGQRNLGGIMLENSIKEHLRDAGFDLMIICGCFENFYRKLEFECNPDWLFKSPFNLPSGDDDRDQVTYNRDLFFFFPLTDKYEQNIKGCARDKFSFRFKSVLMNEYYGLDIIVGGFQGLQI